MIIVTTTDAIVMAFLAGQNFSGSDFDIFCREKMADFCQMDNEDLPDTACEKCNTCPFIKAMKRGYEAR